MTMEKQITDLFAELEGKQLATSCLLLALVHSLPRHLRAKVFEQFDTFREAGRGELHMHGEFSDALIAGFDNEIGAIDQTRLPT
jgi:hypothetical protein